MTDTSGLEKLQAQIDALRKENRSLKRSETELRQLIDTMNEGLAVLDDKGRIKFANSKLAQILAYSPGDLIGKRPADLMDDENRRILERNFELNRQGVYPSYDQAALRSDGETIFIRVSPSPFPDTGACTDGCFAMISDISERKQNEERISTSLKEKEVLLREIHHRVKNNLQVVSSLLEMTRGRTENEQAREILADAKAKVHTMALIHSQLYRDERFDEIDMKRHIHDMIAQLAHLFCKNPRIQAYVDAEGVTLSVIQAIPCALVLNELISNAYKHAFENRDQGNIHISMANRPNDMISLRIRDDGIGMPQDMQTAASDSLGWKLVRNLVQKQLGGDLNIASQNGTDIHIAFKKGV